MSTSELGNSCGDHNAMVIDLDIKKLFHLSGNECMAPISRKLKSDDIKGVEKYANTLKASLEDHTVLTRMKNLRMELKGKKVMSAYNKKVYEGIDADVYKLFVNVEKKYEKANLGTSCGLLN